MNSKGIADRARKMYESRLKAQLEPANRGRYVVIDVNSGDYEVGDDYLIPTKKLHARHPSALLHTIKIGYPVAGRIGGRAAPVTR